MTLMVTVTDGCDSSCLTGPCLHRARRKESWLLKIYTAFIPCSGVDQKAQGPLILVPSASDVSGNVPLRGDLEPKANFLLTFIAMN